MAASGWGREDERWSGMLRGSATMQMGANTRAGVSKGTNEWTRRSRRCLTVLLAAVSPDLALPDAPHSFKRSQADNHSPTHTVALLPCPPSPPTPRNTPLNLRSLTATTTPRLLMTTSLTSTRHHTAPRHPRHMRLIPHPSSSPTRALRIPIPSSHIRANSRKTRRVLKITVQTLRTGNTLL